MVGQRHAPAVLPPDRDPVPIVQEARWAPGPVWMGAEKLSHTGFRSPDRSTRSDSVYRLRYPGPHRCHFTRNKGICGSGRISPHILNLETRRSSGQLQFTALIPL